jgi:hypothetical protein
MAFGSLGEGEFMDLTDFHYYEPSQGHGLRHNPFNAIVAAPNWLDFVAQCGGST